MYDVAIIGTGPAGMSAALNLKLHNKSMIWFGSKNLSEKVAKSEKIANYPGNPMIKGEKLNQVFLKQINEMELEITDSMVTNVMSIKDHFMLLANNEMYEAKSVVLATGSVTDKGLDGEDDFLGRGLSYCATCDGFLYRGKTIAVFSNSNRYDHEIKYLADIAEKVYLYTTYDYTSDSDKIEKLKSPMISICGKDSVTAIKLMNEEVIAIDGLFMLRNALKPTTILKGLKMDGAHVVVDRSLSTNIKGFYACGDCTGRPYQLTKAVGEGNVAAHSVLSYLEEFDKDI